jgi:hypothetical protein
MKHLIIIFIAKKDADRRHYADRRPTGPEELMTEKVFIFFGFSAFFRPSIKPD